MNRILVVLVVLALALPTLASAQTYEVTSSEPSGSSGIGRMAPNVVSGFLPSAQAQAEEQPGGEILQQIDAIMPTAEELALPQPPFSLRESASGVITLEQYVNVFQSQDCQGCADVAAAIQQAGTDYHFLGQVMREWNTWGETWGTDSECPDRAFMVLGSSVLVFGSEDEAQAYLADEAIHRAWMAAVNYQSLDFDASTEALMARGMLPEGECGALTMYMQETDVGRFVSAATLLAYSSAREADMRSVLITVNQIAAKKLMDASLSQSVLKTVEPSRADDLSDGSAAADGQPAGDVLQQIDTIMPTAEELALSQPPFSLSENEGGWKWTMEQSRDTLQSIGYVEAAAARQQATTDYHFLGLVFRQWIVSGGQCPDTAFFTLGSWVHVFGSEAEAQAFLADESLQRAWNSADTYPLFDMDASPGMRTIRMTYADTGCGVYMGYVKAINVGRFDVEASLVTYASASEADMWSILNRVNQVMAQKLADAGIQ